MTKPDDKKTERAVGDVDNQPPPKRGGINERPTGMRPPPPPSPPRPPGSDDDMIRDMRSSLRQAEADRRELVEMLKNMVELADANGFWTHYLTGSARALLERIGEQ